jgi:hypothetical protein
MIVSEFISSLYNKRYIKRALATAAKFVDLCAELTDEITLLLGNFLPKVNQFIRNNIHDNPTKYQQLQIRFSDPCFNSESTDANGGNRSRSEESGIILEGNSSTNTEVRRKAMDNRSDGSPEHGSSGKISKQQDQSLNQQFADRILARFTEAEEFVHKQHKLVLEQGELVIDTCNKAIGLIDGIERGLQASMGGNLDGRTEDRIPLQIDQQTIEVKVVDITE